MTDNVVYLKHGNERTTIENQISVLSCKVCGNKTFRTQYDRSPFPTMYCACCGCTIGRFGWVDEDQS